tara:strand:+ start:470 stop:787 length:318 start_codon:yes stop_codon:yes gene_type:complete
MIDTEKYEGHTEGPWEADLDDEGKRWVDAYDDEGDINLCRITNGNKADAQLIADAPLLLEEVKRLRDGIRGILSDYDITELIRDVPEDEWNFEQQALVRMKEMIE